MKNQWYIRSADSKVWDICAEDGAFVASGLPSEYIASRIVVAHNESVSPVLPAAPDHSHRGIGELWDRTRALEDKFLNHRHPAKDCDNPTWTGKQTVIHGDD